MKEIGFKNDRHVITSEGKLAVGVDGWMIAAAVLCLFRLGTSRFFPAGRAGSEIQGKRRSG
jgi:hypothetical protein